LRASPALNLAVKLTAGNRGNKKILATQGEERENALDGYDRKLWRIAVVEYNRLWVDYGYKQSSPVASQKSSLFIRDSCVYAGKPLSSEVCRTSPERN